MGVKKQPQPGAKDKKKKGADKADEEETSKSKGKDARSKKQGGKKSSSKWNDADLEAELAQVGLRVKQVRGRGCSCGNCSDIHYTHDTWHRRFMGYHTCMHAWVMTILALPSPVARVRFENQIEAWMPSCL